MSKIKESLEANKSEILAALPEEFHEGFTRQLETTTDPVPLTDDEELEAIKAELTANPDVSEAEVIADLEKNPTAHKPAMPPSEETLKAEMEEALKSPPLPPTADESAEEG